MIGIVQKEVIVSKPNIQNTTEQNGLLHPFLGDAFARGVMISLAPGLITCIVAIAPQYKITKILGTDLPISFDAISLILVSPCYFAVMTLLLYGAARRTTYNQVWHRSEINIVKGLITLLALSAAFILIQFFVVLSPAGLCDQRPHWELLWSISPQSQPVNHCMSTAKEINASAWFYLEPVFLQAWAHILLTVGSIFYMRTSWIIWAGKRRKKI